jgi:hypothetical protein
MLQRLLGVSRPGGGSRQARDEALAKLATLGGALVLSRATEGDAL